MNFFLHVAVTFDPVPTATLSCLALTLQKERTVDMSTDTDYSKTHISIEGSESLQCPSIPSLTSIPWWCLHSGMQPRSSLLPSVLLDLRCWLLFRHLLRATPTPTSPPLSTICHMGLLTMVQHCAICCTSLCPFEMCGLLGEPQL